MKARLIPLYFDPGRDQGFDVQLQALHNLLAAEAEILPPLPLGAPLPEAEAVIFPQLLGEAYRQLENFKKIDLPILIITSEFGTVSMWDWEIASYLRAECVLTIAPYSLGQARIVCRALSVKREFKESKFLVFQDNPGEGFQASIFKRFYWWEDECTQRILRKFGVQIVKRSYKELAAWAKEISDEEATKTYRNWRPRLDEKWRRVHPRIPGQPGILRVTVPSIHAEGVTTRALLSSVKLYMAIKREIEREGAVLAAGANCLNESHFSDTTPCLAWNMLYEELGLLWGCEADTVTMLTETLLHHSLGAPVMMTNLYPFLMGQAALKHEHIPDFPQVENPENCILVAHCGYLGVVPESFATEWTLRPKVLAIVDENATAIDARLPVGPVTLAKLSPTMEAIGVVEGNLDGYAQYEHSDCLNGGVIRVPDGPKMLQKLDSHHYILLTGHHREAIRLIAGAFSLGIESLE
jgi:hypothetical protein